MKGLPKNLFKTFIISTLLSVAANCIYYAISQKGAAHDYGHVVPLIVSGAFLLNLIIGLMALPSLFLININYWKNISVRLLLYFAGPLLFLVTVLYMKLQPADAIFYLSTGIIFIILHTIFYFRIIRKNR